LNMDTTNAKEGISVLSAGHWLYVPKGASRKKYYILSSASQRTATQKDWVSYNGRGVRIIS